MDKKVNKYVTPSGKKIHIVLDDEDFLCIRLKYKKSFRKFFRTLIEIYKSILFNMAKTRFYPYLEGEYRSIRGKNEEANI